MARRTVDVVPGHARPSAPTDGDTVTVSGTVTNKGKQTVTDAHVDLRVGQLLTTRSAIDDVAARTDYVPGADGTEVGGKYVEKFPKLAPGVAQPFTISVPVDKLDLGQDGVYQLGVSLRARPPPHRTTRCSASSGPSCRGSPRRRTPGRGRRICGR